MRKKARTRRTDRPQLRIEYEVACCLGKSPASADAISSATGIPAKKVRLILRRLYLASLVTRFGVEHFTLAYQHTLERYWDRTRFKTLWSVRWRICPSCGRGTLTISPNFRYCPSCRYIREKYPVDGEKDHMFKFPRWRYRYDHEAAENMTRMSDDETQIM